MSMGVKSIKHLKGYKLTLLFDNGEERVIDMEPFLNKGKLQELKDPRVFKTAHISFDTVEWSNGVDICPEFLYEYSQPPVSASSR